MAEIDRLNRQLLDEIAFREDWKPIYQALNHLFDLMRQTRTRTGGDVDIVSATASISNTNFYAGAYFEEKEDLSLFPVPENEEIHEFNQRYALLLS